MNQKGHSKKDEKKGRILPERPPASVPMSHLLMFSRTIATEYQAKLLTSTASLATKNPKCARGGKPQTTRKKGRGRTIHTAASIKRNSPNQQAQKKKSKPAYLSADSQ